MTEDVRSREERLAARYTFLLKYLGLSADALRDKKIVDAGCGEGALVRGLLTERVSSSAFGFDTDIRDAQADAMLGKNVFHADYHEVLPEELKNADVVTAFAVPEWNAVSGPAPEMVAVDAFVPILLNLSQLLATEGKIVCAPLTLRKGEAPASLLTAQVKKYGFSTEFVPTGEWRIRNHKTGQIEIYDAYAMVFTAHSRPQAK